MKITEPLILSVGYHGPGSGRGCAMEALSWATGDGTVTDEPACSHHYLALLVQNFNDLVGNEWGIYPYNEKSTWVNTEGRRILSMSATRQIELQPEHAILAFNLAWETVGTGRVAISTEQHYDWHVAVRKACGIGLWTNVEAVSAAHIKAGEIENAAGMISTAIAVFRRMFLPEQSTITLPSAADVNAALVAMRENVSA